MKSIYSVTDKQNLGEIKFFTGSIWFKQDELQVKIASFLEFKSLKQRHNNEKEKKNSQGGDERRKNCIILKLCVARRVWSWGGPRSFSYIFSSSLRFADKNNNSNTFYYFYWIESPKRRQKTKIKKSFLYLEQSSKQCRRDVKILITIRAKN